MSRSLAPVSLLLASIASLALVGCGGGDNTPSPNVGEPSAQGGSSGTSGAGGASGSSGSSAGGSAGSSGGGSAGSSGGAGGSSGGAGGSSAMGGSAGASGASGGAGASGQAGSPGFEGQDVASCTFDKAQDLGSGTAEVKQVGTSYQPACIKIKVGQSVSFTGDFGSHPLAGMKDHGTQPNPIGNHTSGPVSVTFDAPGSYGYYCTVHGADDAPGQSGMSGAVYVVP